MYWKSKIDFNQEELDMLNAFATKHLHSSEEAVPNALQQFPFATQKVHDLLNEYLSKDYVKYLVQSWSIYIPKGDFIPYNPHQHGYCHLSFIFYTKNTGENPLVLRDNSSLEFKLNLKTNDFIILPREQVHMVEAGEAKSDRISFAGDILLTEREYKSSLFLPPKNIWQEL